MKKVYIKLNGVLGNYAAPLRTKSTTGFKRLQTMQAALNETVKMYSNTEATEQSCKVLWETLFGIAKKIDAELFDAERKSDTYKEIEVWLGNIGYEIAWGSRRKGIDKNTYSKTVKEFAMMNTDNPEFINTYLKVLTCIASMPEYRGDDRLFAAIDEMDDAEIYELAVEKQNVIKDAILQETYHLYTQDAEIPF